MNLQRWIARREQSWKQLDNLLKQAESRKPLNADEIHQLASLYRSVSGDLARAKTQSAGNTTIQNLQLLTTRAYGQIYQGARHQEWRSLLDFYLWGFPAVVQRSRGYIALGTVLLVGMGIVSWWLAWTDPSFMNMLVPEHILTQVRDRGELWMGSIIGVEPLASTGILINNIVVSLGAAVGGITGGILTVRIMLFNGLVLGPITALVAQNNLAYPFWAFVFPHGSLELPAIFLSSGSGFLIARALLFPGQYRRVDALKIYGQQAIQLMFGVIPMLVVAGFIEGFFSPSPAVPSLLKYIVGTGLLIGLLAYLSRRKPA
jgi:uncharacterized membrane protein SpoIIM required for sporulation